MVENHFDKNGDTGSSVDSITNIKMRKKQTKVNEKTINISDFIVSLTGLELGRNGCKKNKKITKVKQGK